MCERASRFAPSRTATGSHSLIEPDAFDGDALGHRVEVRRTVGLEIVRERIHADRGGYLGRQADRELRILDHQSGKHLRVKDDLLGVIAHIGDDRGATDFRAGPGRGGHRDDRGHALGADARVPVLAILEIPDRPVLADHQRDRLGGVERAATAEGDDTVVPPAAIDRHAAADVGLDRVTLHVGVHLAAEPGAPARFHRGGDHRQRRQPRIGHEQGTLHPERAAGIRQLRDTTGAEADRGRVIPVAAQFPCHVRSWCVGETISAASGARSRLSTACSLAPNP